MKHHSLYHTTAHAFPPSHLQMPKLERKKSLPTTIMSFKLSL